MTSKLEDWAGNEVITGSIGYQPIEIPISKYKIEGALWLLKELDAIAREECKVGAVREYVQGYWDAIELLVNRAHELCGKEE